LADISADAHFLFRKTSAAHYHLRRSRSIVHAVSSDLTNHLIELEESRRRVSQQMGDERSLDRMPPYVCLPRNKRTSKAVLKKEKPADQTVGFFIWIFSRFTIRSGFPWIKKERMLSILTDKNW
jgi:hypothetical protein